MGRKRTNDLALNEVLGEQPAGSPAETENTVHTAELVTGSPAATESGETALDNIRRFAPAVADAIEGETRLARVNRLYGDGLAYDFRRYAHECAILTGEWIRLAVELGKRLTVIKEHEGHGKFCKFVETNLNLDRKSAATYMAIARRAIEVPEYMQEYRSLAKSKHKALLAVPDDEIAEFIQEHPASELDGMTVAQLRAEKERWENEAKRKTASNKRLNEENLELKRRLRGKPLLSDADLIVKIDGALEKIATALSEIALSPDRLVRHSVEARARYIGLFDQLYRLSQTYCRAAEGATEAEILDGLSEELRGFYLHPEGAEPLESAASVGA